MDKKIVTFQWKGVFIELCRGRITRAQKDHLDAVCSASDNSIETLWYEKRDLLRDIFEEENWWAADDLDHVMGLNFADKSTIQRALEKLETDIDGTPITIDPETVQMSFYAPETHSAVDTYKIAICHGTRRQAVLGLQAEFNPPFDPSLITLSFLHYPDYGYILLDLDYDGHDDSELTFGQTTYLSLRFLGKGPF